MSMAILSVLEIAAGPQRPPPATKDVVANLPVVIVIEEVIARLGSATECVVCRENLVVNDKMQEFPCKHLFYPPCLKPWLGEHNSCPIYHAYESRKEREKEEEEEEERKGAANALRGGEFMSFKVILCYYFIPIGKDVNQLQVSWQSSGRSRAFFDAHDP